MALTVHSAILAAVATGVFALLFVTYHAIDNPAHNSKQYKKHNKCSEIHINSSFLISIYLLLVFVKDKGNTAQGDSIYFF